MSERELRDIKNNIEISIPFLIQALSVAAGNNWIYRQKLVYRFLMQSSKI